MNRLAIFLLALPLVAGCQATSHREANSIHAEIGAILKNSPNALDFEIRLKELGAFIQPGSNPMERVAMFPQTSRLRYVGVSHVVAGERVRLRKTELLPVSALAK